MPTKLLGVLLLLLSMPSLGQRSHPYSPKPAPKPRQQLAGLVTTRQVRQFLERQCEGFLLSSSHPAACVGRGECALSGAAQIWLKADLDGNGRIDLLVAGQPGKYAYQNALVGFLDVGKLKPQVLKVLYQELGCVMLQLIQVKHLTAIRYTHPILVGERFTQNVKLVCQADTLIVSGGQLIEYNRAPKDYHIQQVSFRTGACFGSCPIFELRLNRDGTASYYAEEYNDQQGRFAATIAPIQVAELWHLLNYLNFPRLRNFYNVGVTDQATCILTITYANGQVKTIEDYGKEGTLGLRQVYRLLFALRTTQAWK